MHAQVRQAGLHEYIVVDSAGTGNWHIGQAPDERAQYAARQRGYDLSKLRGRQITAADFERFDLLIAMDQANLRELRKICPSQYLHKTRLFMEFAAQAQTNEVADPYFGGAEGFETVLDQCEQACRGLLAELRAK